MKRIISLALVMGLVLFLLAPLGYAEGEEEENPDEPQITGFIEIVNTVENAVSGMPDRDFEFMIRLSDPDDYISYDELSYYIVGVDAEGEFRHVSNGGIFRLKAGQTARFFSIHNGRPYVIHGIPSANFVQTVPDVSEYTGQHDGTETSLLFKNRYVSDDKSIKVTKTVSGENAPDRLFKFRISISGDNILPDEMLYQITDSNGNVYHEENYAYESGSYPDYRSADSDGIFYLRAGQTARFPFVSSGHSYIIHEIPCVNFVQTQPDGGSYSGIFESTETVLPFENGYNGSDKALEISKSVSDTNEDISDSVFNFVINLSGEINENELLYEVADSEGNIAEGVNGDRYFSADSDGIFSIKDGQTARFKFVNSGRSYKIYEIPMPHFQQTKPVQSDYQGSYDGNGLLLPFVNKYISETEIPKAVFKNTKKQDGLEVMKTVTNQDDFTPDTKFEFVITLTSDSDEVSSGELLYQIIDIEGRVYDINGQLHSQYLEDGVTVDNAYNEYRSAENGGKFYLKDGQIARFPYIKNGHTYEISENCSGRFVQIQPLADEGYTGKYEGIGKRLEFINEYRPRSDEKSLTVEKYISAPIGYMYESDIEFAFKIKVNGEIYANKQFAIKNEDGVYREDITDENGIFYLKADEQAMFMENSPFTYHVEEIISDAQTELGWRTVGDSFFDSNTAEDNDVIFVNTNASLVVQKVMMDGSQPDDSFVFHITDIYERGLQARYYLYDTDGNILDDGQLHTTSASQGDVSKDGEFILKANQAAYFIGLNRNRTYNIYEEFMDGYVQRVPATSDGYNVRIKERAEILTFRNDRQTLKGVLKVNKSVTDLVPSETAPNDKEFVFQLLMQTGEDTWEAVAGESYTINEGVSQVTYSTDDDGMFKLHKNETAVFRHLEKPRTYKVTEQPLNDSEYKDSTDGEGITGELTYDSYLNFIYRNLYKPEMTDIVITKIDESDHSKRLAGAKFTVYTDEAMTKILEESVESDENGRTVFRNLKAGTYYIKETKAPSYYDRSKTVLKVIVYKDEENEGRLNVRISSLTSESEIPVEQKSAEDDEFENPYFIVSGSYENGFFENDCLYFRFTNKRADILPKAGGMLLWFNMAGYIFAFSGGLGIVTAFGHKYRAK